MKGPGIFSMLQIAAGMSMAGPMFIIGFDLARTGQPAFGVAFFVFGLFALYFPTYLVNRIGGPRAWIRRRLGRSEGSRDETDAGRAGESDDTDERDGVGPSSLLARLRR